METRLSTSGEVADGASAGCKKKHPPSRLQKHAPATLQLEPGAPSPSGAWGYGRTPIPLLSPLVMSSHSPPPAAWEADNQAGATRREVGHADASARSGRDVSGGGRSQGCNVDRQPDEAAKAPAPAPFGGWRHPALPTPVAEPVSLAPFFQSQCALEVRNAQQ
ncbi:hypothetical protein GUJ93_ZPchr0013g33812 [Zizania palustris]|uniref:Uncharacterized protein n=1 Tax=Zizania palustris TaxID=103762 RepID=A0A8J5WWD2_ZIZPA|nr:hypothetical protein GUJ93_ZPchr0013g33812 [Zizania palustris]